MISYAAMTDELRELYVDEDRSLEGMKVQSTVNDSSHFRYVYVDDIARGSRHPIELTIVITRYSRLSSTTVDAPTEVLSRHSTGHGSEDHVLRL